MDDLQVIRYSPEYKQQVKEFVIAAHKEFGFPYKSWWDGDLEDPDEFYNKSGGIFYLLLDGMTVVGSAAIKKRENGVAELKRLYLNKELRGKKLGLKLFNLLLDFAKVNNFTKITLSTNKKQLEAIRLYEENGFIVDETLGNVIYMSRDV